MTVEEVDFHKLGVGQGVPGGDPHRVARHGLHRVVVVAVTGAIDGAVLAGLDVEDAAEDIARVVVAAEDLEGVLSAAEVDTLHGEGGGTEDVRTPAATIDGVEGLVPSVENDDVAIFHIATAAAAVGCG